MNINPTERLSDKIDLPMMNALLAAQHDTLKGDPDLLFVFGRGEGEALVLEGYPPWELRLTEICHVKNPDPTFQDFLDGLDIEPLSDKIDLVMTNVLLSVQQDAKGGDPDLLFEFGRGEGEALVLEGYPP
ncbi:hypothetical protein HDU98_000073, partial [Podochytrium sp. JEL0797]